MLLEYLKGKRIKLLKNRRVSLQSWNSQSFLQKDTKSLIVKVEVDKCTDLKFNSVQSLSRVWLLATPWTAARQASLSITNSQNLLKLMSIELVMPSNCLILCHPLLLLPSIFPSMRVFSNESTPHEVAKVLELQLQHQSFQRIFRTDFLQNGLVGSPCSPRDSQESSPTPQFGSINCSAQLSLQSNSHIHTWPQEKP